MSDGKPGTSLVPITPVTKSLAADVRTKRSRVLRQASELARYAEAAEKESHSVAGPHHNDQSRSKVHGDQVGADKIDGNKFVGDIFEGNATKIGKQYNIQLPHTATIIEKLLARLEHEMDNDIKISDTITRLQRYHGGVVRDDVIGLVAKLQRSGREAEIEAALEQKEEFAKLLETWSLYYSAQEIFVFLLARAEHTFNSEVMPEIASCTIGEINRLINRDIVNPMVEECAMSVLQLDHVSAMGMLYWLAEQCFIRWH
jgi:hypothetical protein